MKSISPTHPRPKDDRCADVQLPEDHDKESTHITYLSLLELFTTSRASRIAHSSAVYMDACPGKRLLTILKFETTAHPQALDI